MVDFVCRDLGEIVEPEAEDLLPNEMSPFMESVYLLAYILVLTENELYTQS